jgi:hypothetical protein
MPIARGLTRSLIEEYVYISGFLESYSRSSRRGTCNTRCKVSPIPVQEQESCGEARGGNTLGKSFVGLADNQYKKYINHCEASLVDRVLLSTNWKALTPCNFRQGTYFEKAASYISKSNLHKP